MKAKLLSLLCAAALASAFGETTYRLALRDEAGHFLGTDDSVNYYYRVYDLTQKKYLHDPTYRYEIKLIDGGTHNVEFMADSSSWDPDYRAKEGDELRLEIYDAKNDFAKIGTVDDLPRVSEGETEILTPMIMALPQPGVATRNPLDLVHQLADDDSAVYWALWCAEAEGDFGGGWSDEAERKWQVGCDPYGGALSKAEVVAALTEAGYPDLSRPAEFSCSFSVSDYGEITARLTVAPGHVYTLWQEKAGVRRCFKTEVVSVSPDAPSGELTITTEVPTDEIYECDIELTIDGYPIKTIHYKPWPLSVRVNGVDVVHGAGAGWKYSNRLLVLSGEGPFVLAGANTSGRVSVRVSTDTTIKLDNLTLTADNPFVIESGHQVVVALKGWNYLTATGDDYAAIWVDHDSKLTLDRAEASSDARLQARGGKYGAAIGCGYNALIGDIEIKGGRIRAEGGEFAQYDIGIPGNNPRYGSFTTIKISGGTVDARYIGANYTQSLPPPFGSGSGDHAKVTINGGSVIANMTSPSPKNAEGASVYAVQIENLMPNKPITLAGLPEYYGTNDVFAVSGPPSVCLWLPSGTYTFSDDGVPYLATVRTSRTTATKMDFWAVIELDEEGRAIVNPNKKISGCSYSVIASETLDFKDTAILPIGLIEDPKYRFFRVRVSAK